MPRVTAAHRQRRRQQLLTAAEHVFCRLGYTRARLQDVMDEAGVSRGGLYLYFANKEDLFRAVMAWRDEPALGRLAKLGLGKVPVAPFLRDASAGPDVPDEAARRWIAAAVEFGLAHRGQPAHVQQMRDRYERFVAALVQVLAAGERRGELHPVLPLDTVARFWLAAQDGAVLGIVTYGETFWPRETFGPALRLFLAASLGLPQ
ncbi:TetR/AcrR family transcriptional regulator [Sulfobacillus harzensis]|uniref:TetR/AcrR family transcriptional regulator n=1 Tax=Sulfobacillus harzensis TaxID=2729629 RepID=A0A7Y0L7N6_9FIRM|nr:TetR/AcrR family transcriptional regulator [Sulfobacillus harzensis]NMP23439.1 TetR/AcrR family transcriptional regulator [Sulfobacillus harzensis]